MPFQQELSIARKRWKMILAFVLAAGLAGALIAALIPDKYTAMVQYAVDNKTMELRQQDAIYSDSSVTDAFVESQVEILKSEPIAIEVIHALDLTADKEFVPDRRPLRDQIADFTGWHFLGNPNGTDPMRIALYNFKRVLAVHRVGLSNIVEARVRTTDPQKSADIANTISSVYLQWQSKERSEAAKSASAWLRNRVQNAGPSTTVLSRAERPTFTSGIGDTIIVGAFLVLGACFGSATAFLAEVADRRIRSKADLVGTLGLNCYGVLPTIALRRDLAPAAQTRALFDYALRHPTSSFAHAIQHSRLAATAFHPGDTVRTIGVTSCHGGVGKSVVAANLARSISQARKCDVLLIDGNPYNPTLTRLLAPGATAGLADVLEGTARLEDALIPFEKVSILPLAGTTGTGRRIDMIWTTALNAMIDEALARFEIIVFDLPATEPSADVRASAHVLDVFLLVVGAGENADRVRESLAAIDDLDRKISGVILNEGVKI